MRRHRIMIIVDRKETRGIKGNTADNRLLTSYWTLMNTTPKRILNLTTYKRFSWETDVRFTYKHKSTGITDNRRKTEVTLMNTEEAKNHTAYTVQYNLQEVLMRGSDHVHLQTQKSKAVMDNTTDRFWQSLLHTNLTSTFIPNPSLYKALDSATILCRTSTSSLRL